MRDGIGWFITRLTEPHPINTELFHLLSFISPKLFTSIIIIHQHYPSTTEGLYSGRRLYAQVRKRGRLLDSRILPLAGNKFLIQVPGKGLSRGGWESLQHDTFGIKRQAQGGSAEADKSEAEYMAKGYKWGKETMDR